MDVNKINPIINAVVEILPQIGFEKVDRKGISLIGSTIEYSGLIINIGILGTIKGAVLIGMNMDSAKRFASKMMMGMEVEEFDNVAQSAISEMGNMVCANACTHFSNAGIEGMDISPPTIMLSKLGTATLPAQQAILLSFIVDEIDFNMYIALI